MLPRLPDQQIIRRSKFQLFLGEVGAVLASLWGLNLLLRRDEIVGLFLFTGAIIFFFGLLHHHRRNEPVIMLDKAGITIPDFGVGKILWTDIRTTSVEYRIKVGQILCLYLTDETKYLNLQREPSRLGRAIDHLYGFPTFNHPLAGLEMTPTQLQEEITRYHQAANKSAQNAATPS